MSYGSPALDPSNRTYAVTMNHATITGSGDVVATLSFGNIAEEEDTDACMQAFVDVVSAAENFVVTSAVKVTPSSQAITPT